MKELPHAVPLPRVDCSICHSDTVRQYAASVHGKARTDGTVDAATCASCHGPAHEVVPASDKASRVAKRNLAATCGSCHANADFLARHAIPFAHPVEAYERSTHGRAVAAGNEKAPSCSDCHGSHTILPARDPAAAINHWRVPETCGRCHGEIQKTYAASVHGEASAHGVRDAPVCTDCHGEHTILAPSEPGSLVNPARLSSVTCGRCHADERIATRYNLPRDKVPAYEDSYHGLALKGGSQTVANCASCHGVHNILSARDPRSSVHPANVAKTCGHCHPGAGQRFGVGPVHVSPAMVGEHPAVRLVRVAYWILIPLTLGFMLVHNTADFVYKIRRPRRRVYIEGEVPRMNIQFRIAHALVFVSFPVLVITGFALKYPDAWWAAPLLALEGHLPLRGIVHRTAAVLLVLAILYHALHLYLVPSDWRVVRLEKIEYWAFVWGCGVMAASGLVLWFENWSLRNLPKWMVDVATSVHWYEAILATLAILVWHLYMVMYDPDVYPMDRAWLTGRTSADHLAHNRPHYYRALKDRRAEPAAEAKEETDPQADPGPKPEPEPED
jgi:cytochrome b subunit of formate dehydrogenase